MKVMKMQWLMTLRIAAVIFALIVQCNCVTGKLDDIRFQDELNSNSNKLEKNVQKPNLVMILTDEHNLRTLSCYQDYFDTLDKRQAATWGMNNTISTPNIDSLANDGVMFTSFYAATPLCTPSRASFMSGKYPQNTGLPFKGQNHKAIGDDVVTFAEILKKQANYKTAYFGKWHMNGDEKPGWYAPNSTRSFGFEHTKYMFNRGHWKFLDEIDGQMKGFKYGHKRRFDGRLGKHYTTDYLFDRGIDYIQEVVEGGDDPFAMVISIPDPHGPMEVRKPYNSQYEHNKFELPYTAKAGSRRDPAFPHWISYENVGDGIPLSEMDEYLEEYENGEEYQDYLQKYFGMVKCIDWNVGKLIKALKSSGIEEDTIVVFTSDHGDLLGEHGKFNKGVPYYASAGIPFILRYPAKVRKAKIIQTATSNVEFVPTILSLMGVEPPDSVEFDGFDVSREVLNKRKITNLDRVRYSFDVRDVVVWAAAMMKQYKLVISASDVPWLFDLNADPYEIINFFDDPEYLEVGTYLLEKLKTAMEKFSFPIISQKILFWSSPTCHDSRDRIEYVNPDILVGTCEDLGDSVPMSYCSRKKWRLKCPMKCGNCCKDPEGPIYMSTSLKTCEEIENKQCRRDKVKIFCPKSCGVC